MSHPITDTTALRDHVAGWRVLLISNRCNTDVADQLTRTLGIACQVEDVSHKPRHRRSLVERIERRSYDAALVAHGFVGHGDTRSISAACRRAGVPYIATGKGRLVEVLAAMQAVLLPRPPSTTITVHPEGF